MAYLTFDADIKEEFVVDEAALRALFQLSKVALGCLQGTPKTVSAATSEPCLMPGQWSTAGRTLALQAAH